MPEDRVIVIVETHSPLDLVRKRLSAQYCFKKPADAVICGRNLYEAVKLEAARLEGFTMPPTEGPEPKLMGKEFYVSDDLEPNEIIIGQRS